MIHAFGSPITAVFNVFSCIVGKLENTRGVRALFRRLDDVNRSHVHMSREKQYNEIRCVRCETRKPRGPVKQEGTDYPPIIGCHQITSSLILQSHLHLVCSSNGTIRRPA